MSRARISVEVLEHMLDLPEGASIVAMGDVEVVDGVPCVTLVVEDHSGTGMLDGDGFYALAYEQNFETGEVALVSAVPVPE